jgi:hypothetical protein
MTDSAPLLGRCKDCDYALFTAAADVRQADNAQAGGPAVNIGNGQIMGRCTNGHRWFALKRVKGTYSKDHKCDSRCLNAKGHECTCSCGGANHGRGHAVTVVQASELPRTYAGVQPVVLAPDYQPGGHDRGQFVGEIGKHIKGAAKLINARWVREGATRLYTFETAKGDLIKWFCPKTYDPELSVGHTYTFRAKVKGHEDNHRFGKSTIITYWEAI